MSSIKSKKIELRILIEAAKAGADEAARIISTAEIAVEKALGDFATEADLKSQEKILSHLRAEYPEIAIIAEEDEHTGILPTTYFSVDPLDGTFIFSRGCSEWGVLISYVEDSQLQQAVLYQPLFGRVIAAERGKGCRRFSTSSLNSSDSLNSTEAIILKASTEPAPEQIILGLDVNFAAVPEQVRRILFPLMERKKVLVIRTLGCAMANAIDLLSGGIDAYINPVGGKIWDFAPCALAIKEAGGEALFLDGNTMETSPFRTDKLGMGVVFASSPALACALSELFTK